MGAGWVLVRVLGAGCARGGDRLLVPGGGAGGGCWLGIGAGVVSWLCTWWRQVVGADGDRLLAVLGAGRRRRRRWRQVAGAGGIACIYVAIFFAQIAKLWSSYFK